MKNIGKVFEDNIKASIPKNIMVYRPPDQAQAFDMSSTKLRFSRHSPADYFIFDGYKNMFIALECKTFQGSCSFERTKEDKGIIHHYQIKSLNDLSQYYRVVSGFLLDFRKSGNTYFLHISDMNRLLDVLDKKSFNEKDILNICSPILLEKKKLRVNYRYDIGKLLSQMENIYVQS